MKIFSLFKVIFAKDNVEDANGSARGIAMYGGAFFVLIALILTIFNISNGYWVMVVSTVVVACAFALAAIEAYRNRVSAARIVIALICAIVFSYYGVAGQNDGFAILWILLVPVIGTMLVGLRVGFCLSLYFQVFLIAIFYTPFSAYVSDVYTSTFAARFPVLYFAAFAAITLLVCQRQVLFNEAHHRAYYDSLTGLFNRFRYNEISKTADEDYEYRNLTIIAMDLNGLKGVNDKFGHEAGDELIGGAASCIRAGFPDDMCFRIGGDEFAVISTDEHVLERVEAFPKVLEAWKGEKIDHLRMAIGYASRLNNPGMKFAKLAMLADERMYSDKDSYYRQSGIDRRRF